MKKVRVAINGFGRIGRAFLRLAHKRDEIEIVAINDLGDIENIAYLLRHDSVYGPSDFSIEAKSGEGKSAELVVDGKSITFLSEPDPNKLPWGDLDIDIAVESTGVFDSYEKSRSHLNAGAKRVVVSAPVNDEPPEGVVGATVLLGVNEDALKTCDISSNASCTTNAGSPVLAVLNEKLGIESAALNTIHGYTASQSLVDGPHKGDFRRGRAAAANIVPSSTGAAIATTKAIGELSGKFDGIAVRVPVLVGSIVDLTFISKKKTTVEEVNEIFKNATKGDRWKGILSVTEEPLVSSDIIGNTHASIVDLNMTRVINGNLVKVMSWYDNEMGYTNTLVEHVIRSGQYIQ